MYICLGPRAWVTYTACGKYIIPTATRDPKHTWQETHIISDPRVLPACHLNLPVPFQCPSNTLPVPFQRNGTEDQDDEEEDQDDEEDGTEDQDDEGEYQDDEEQ